MIVGPKLEGLIEKYIEQPLMQDAKKELEMLLRESVLEKLHWYNNKLRKHKISSKPRSSV